MNIRQLVDTDAAAFRALRLRALRDHPEAFTSSFEEASFKPLSESEQLLTPQSNEQFWGAFNDEVMVGIVGLSYEQRMKVRHKAMVVSMYVAPEKCHRGVGRALLNALVDKARADGLESLTLTVTVGNEAAERLYLDAGFVSFGIEPKAIKVENNYFAENQMRKSLERLPRELSKLIL